MADKPEILIHSPWYEPAMRRLDELAVTHHLYLADDREAFLAERGPRCRFIGTFHHCPASLMDAAPDLELVLNFGVGYDGVDMEEAGRRGVRVVNTPDVLNDCVADMALALVLAGRRHLVQAAGHARAGKWITEGDYPYTPHVAGARIGILGMGRIGREIAARCAAFKMEIGYHARSRRPDLPYAYYDSLLDMARASDILVAIVPGGAGTLNMVDEAVMKALGPDGYLVNVARGTVVDNEALARCLADGRLGGAAVDVYPDEPEIPACLMEAGDNLILTPHIASATHRTRMAMGMILYDNLAAWLAGEPLLTPVN